MQPIILSHQFSRLHGMSLGQALTGHVRNSEGQVLSPDEAAEYYGKWHRPVNMEELKVEPFDRQLRRWASDHRSFLVGQPNAVAKNIIAFDANMRIHGRPNDLPLYRGDKRSPLELADLAPDYPQSFTTDRFVARSFAKPSYSGPTGRVWKQEPGSVRGVSLLEHGVRTRTVGKSRRPEEEFLVDPRSIH
jgi:hypothetical protein